MAIFFGMCRRGDRVGAVLEYFHNQTFSEALGHRVQVADHCVAPPAPHQVDGICVHLCHK